MAQPKRKVPDTGRQKIVKKLIAPFARTKVPGLRRQRIVKAVLGPLARTELGKRIRYAALPKEKKLLVQKLHKLNARAQILKNLIALQKSRKQPLAELDVRGIIREQYKQQLKFYVGRFDKFKDKGLIEIAHEVASNPNKRLAADALTTIYLRKIVIPIIQFEWRNINEHANLAEEFDKFREIMNKKVGEFEGFDIYVKRLQHSYDMEVTTLISNVAVARAITKLQIKFDRDEINFLARQVQNFIYAANSDEEVQALRGTWEFFSTREQYDGFIDTIMDTLKIFPKELPI